MSLPSNFMRGLLLAVFSVFLALEPLHAAAAPSVTGTNPSGDSTWVLEGAKISATFSEAMDPATITAKSFSLERNAGVVAIAAGGKHTVVLKGDGTVQDWGYTSCDFLPPFKKKPAGLTSVVSVAAGGGHALALKADGTVVAWGNGQYGQLAIPAGLSNVRAIAAGWDHSLALKADGTVVAWGENADGQSSVPPGLSNVVAVAGGGYHSLALKGDGTVVAWGNNDNGQTAVPGDLSGVVAIAAGDLHSLALKNDGTVVAWGDDSAGQATIPAEFNLSSIVAISAGAYHSAALGDDGSVFTWGYSEPGQIEVPADFPPMVAIAAGGWHTVTLKGDGSLLAWGANGYGQAKIPANLAGVAAISGGTEHSAALTGSGEVVVWGNKDIGRVPEGLSGVTAIAASGAIQQAGGDCTVALKGDGTVVAWGSNYWGQTSIPEGLANVSAVAAGGRHAMALKGDGTVVAWGNNSVGQTAVPVGLTGVTAVAAGGWHSVGLKSNGTVVAWGLNENGQTAVPGGLSGVVAIAAGERHTVALKGDGTVVAWGLNDFGQTTIPLGLSGVVAIAAGGKHTVALKNNGTVVVWGNNYWYQKSVPAGLTGVVKITAGGRHVMALKADGTVVAWGDNSYGQSTIPSSPSFVPVPATLSYDAGSRTASLQPVTPLAPATLYRATVFGRSVSGTPLAGSSSWNFSTGESMARHFVTAKAGPGGRISPVTGRWIVDGTVASFTLTPDAAYVVDSATGCDGELVGNIYTTGPVLQGCTVEVYFRPRAPAAITVPVADPDGAYTVSWGASPAVGVTYVVEEATQYDFSDATEIYNGTALSKVFPLVGHGHVQGTTYYYRVKAKKPGFTDSDWKTGVTGCAVPGTVLPALTTLTVPLVDANGSYNITWGASSVLGVTYVLQEATNSTFTVGLRDAYVGPDTTAPIAGRATNVTYFYRVKAIKGGYKDSAWKSLTAGCKVIGEGQVAATPATLTVPASDLDGVYAVSWGTSLTKGVEYVLEEATAYDFSNAAEVYRGTALTKALTGRSQDATYYYRVKAVHPEYTGASVWKVGAAGCAVPGTVLPALTTLTVPLVDANGSYNITWGASSVLGVTYVLQEATNSTFTVGLRDAYVGPDTTAPIAGRATNVTYFYRVKAIKGGYKDSAWKSLTAGCKVIGEGQVAATPATLTVPASDLDGVYAVSWGTSLTKGVEYVLEEATAYDFSNAAEVYRGTALTKALTGRSQNTTYYYRVKAVHPEYTGASAWKVGAAGCALPGTTLAAPATLTVPAADADGAYNVTWSASMVEGVTYVLQEATNSTFSLDLREAYQGAGTMVAITGRSANVKYYYRVKVVKDGYKSSLWKSQTIGCLIKPPTIVANPHFEVYASRTITSWEGVPSPWEDPSVDAELIFSANQAVDTNLNIAGYTMVFINTTDLVGSSASNATFPFKYDYLALNAGAVRINNWYSSNIEGGPDYFLGAVKSKNDGLAAFGKEMVFPTAGATTLGIRTQGY